MRLRPALCLILAASLSLGGGTASVAAPPVLDIHVGQAGGLSHIEFRGAQPRSARREGKDLILSFGPIAPSDFSLLTVDPPRWLKTAEVKAAKGGTELRLVLADDAQAKLGRADGATFVNLTAAPPPPQPVPAAAPVAHPAAAPAVVPKPPPAPPDQTPPKRPDPVPASGVVTMTPELQGRTLVLRFPWKAPLGAAVFRRGGAVWVVFDAKATLDLSQAPHGLPQVHRMDAVSGPDFSAVRIEAPENVLAGASAEGAVWTVSLGPAMSPPASAVQVMRDDATGPTALKAEVAGSTGVFWIPDPVVGDRVAAVTARAPTKGLAVRQAFVGATLLPSVQGLGIEPVADDLQVRTDGDVVRIGRPRGLALSPLASKPRRVHAPAPAPKPVMVLPQPAAMPALVNFKDWPRTGEGGFLSRYDQLLKAAADETAKGRGAGVQARMGLARFLVGSELSFEAIGVLNMTLRAEPSLAGNAEFRGLRGAARAMARRYKDAQADFSAPVVANDPSSALWRGYIATRLGDYAGARQQFAMGRSALAAFAPKWKARFARSQAEAALAAGDLGEARGALLIASAEKLEPLEAAAVQLDQARLMEASGQADKALGLYERLSQLDYGAISAPALLHAVQIKLAKGRMPLPAAISALDSLRFRWRGDATELETARALGHIYLSQGRYADGLSVLRSASKTLADLPAAVGVQTDLTNAFRSLFLDGQADGLQPIQALALFFDFKELTPIGADGDQMVRKLARRLVDVDLLDQAAELLKYQAENRLDGTPRAEVSTDLATIDLMARKPEDALAAINESRNTLLPTALQARRRVIEARAWTQLGQFDHAMEILGSDKSPDAEDARAEVAWSQHDWPKAGALLEAELGERWRSPAPLAPDEESRLLRAGTAYSLAADDKSLARLRERYGKLAQAARAPDALKVALAGSDAEPLGSADYDRIASETDAFAGWVAEMKRRFLAAPPPGTATAVQAAPAAKRG